MSAAKLAVFASGSGSNFEAIASYFSELSDSRTSGPAVIPALLVSNNAAAGALAKAKAMGVPCAVLSDHESGDEVLSLLEKHGVTLVALAGYLKLIPPEVVRRFRDAMLNIHPALLPDFGGKGMYGMRVHRAVLDSGAAVTGASVHLVTDEYDRGPIIAQCEVAVLAGDDANTLAARVLETEHIFYPRVIELFARGAVSARKPLFIPEGVDPREFMKHLELIH